MNGDGSPLPQGYIILRARNVRFVRAHQRAVVEKLVDRFSDSLKRIKAYDAHSKQTKKDRWIVQIGQVNQYQEIKVSLEVANNYVSLCEK